MKRRSFMPVWRTAIAAFAAFLIIAPDAFHEVLKPYVHHKQLQLSTEVVSLEGVLKIWSFGFFSSKATSFGSILLAIWIWPVWSALSLAVESLITRSLTDSTCPRELSQ